MSKEPLQQARAALQAVADAMYDPEDGDDLLDKLESLRPNIDSALEAIAQPVQQASTAQQKDAVLQASIDFIASLTGMTPPDIEVAPPEVFAPFKAFADKVCAIFVCDPVVQADPIADMFWNHDDAERSYDSIDELLNEEICNGCLEVGAVFTIQRAISHPMIKILVTAIDTNECQAQYEVVADEPIKCGAA